MIFALIFVMMCLLAPAGNAQTAGNPGQDLFAMGNEAYVKGNYDEAILHYKEALDQAGFSASLLYNLGNAFFMKNEIGQAILNYERALYLDPENTHIKINLALAREKSGLGMQDEQAFWKRYFKHFTLNQWTWAGVIALGVFSVMTLLNGIRPGLLRGPILKIPFCLCFLLIMAAGTGMILQRGNLNRGVIIAENTRLRLSPFDSAAESGVVKNGKIVQLAKTYEGYIFIEQSNGQSGWIPEDAVEAILPKTDHHRTQTSLTHSITGTINGTGEEPVTDKT